MATTKPNLKIPTASSRAAQIKYAFLVYVASLPLTKVVEELDKDSILEQLLLSNRDVDLVCRLALLDKIEDHLKNRSLREAAHFLASGPAAGCDILQDPKSNVLNLSDHDLEFFVVQDFRTQLERMRAQILINHLGRKVGGKKEEEKNVREEEKEEEEERPTVPHLKAIVDPKLLPGKVTNAAVPPSPLNTLRIIQSAFDNTLKPHCDNFLYALDSAKERLTEPEWLPLRKEVQKQVLFLEEIVLKLNGLQASDNVAFRNERKALATCINGLIEELEVNGDLAGLKTFDLDGSKGRAGRKY